MATSAPNHAKGLILGGDVDLVHDTCKIILMDEGFSFNIDSDDEYADVSGDELATLYGYTVGGATLLNATLTVDDTNNYAYVSWNNISWSISGGDIATSGAIIYDDTASGDPIIGYIDFSETLTTYDGGTFTIANIRVVAT